jgi:hypothetical protein
MIPVVRDERQGGILRIKMFFRWSWVFLLLVTFSLGCKLVDGLNRAVAIATQVDFEARATEFDLGSIATNIDLDELATEMESVATQFDRGALETQMEAVSTQMGALSTEFDLGQFMTQMPSLLGTPAAFATPAGFPADIPVLAGERLILSGTPNSLQYAVRTDLSSAIQFYRQEMAALGWTESEESRVLEHAAVLAFEKDGRTVYVTIAEDLVFGVMISITLAG